MKRISFEILEPLMFKSGSEFAPGVSGPHAHAESIALPYASTAAGTLCTLVIESMAERVLPLGDWSDQMTWLIGKDALLRGPYLLGDGSEICVQYEGMVIPWTSVLKLARAKLGAEKSSIQMDMTNYAKFVDMAGVKLRDEKASEEKMLYFAKMVDYLERGRRKAICFDLVGDSKNIEKISFPKIVKFGGEGRASRVSILDADETLASIINLSAKDANAVYVASPIVFKTGLSCYEDPEERLREVVRDYMGGIEVERIIGEIRLLGMGFKTQAFQRKPIYCAIFPGSIIKLRTGGDLTTEICLRGVGEFSNLGYGTVIPFS
jgi:CRISPR-associated protein Cmr3